MRAVNVALLQAAGCRACMCVCEVVRVLLYVQRGGGWKRVLFVTAL